MQRGENKHRYNHFRQQRNSSLDTHSIHPGHFTPRYLPPTKTCTGTSTAVVFVRVHRHLIWASHWVPGRVAQVRPLFLMPRGVLCDAPQGSSHGTWPAASTPLLPGRWGWRISTPACPQPSSRLPHPQLQSPHVEGKLLLPQSEGLRASSPDPLFPTAHLRSEGKTVCSSSRASALAQPHPIFPVPPAPLNQLLLPWPPLNLLFSSRRVPCGGHASAPPRPAASRAPALTQHFLHPPAPPQLALAL